MSKKMLMSISFLCLLLVVVIFISSGGSILKKEEQFQKQTVEEGTQNLNAKASIDQSVDQIIADVSAEQTQTKEEDDEISQANIESDSINNLIQSYDESEF